MFGSPHREDVSPQERLDGLLDPLVVHAGGDDGHQLGERRLRLGNGLFDLKNHNNKTRDENKEKKKEAQDSDRSWGCEASMPLHRACWVGDD